MPSFNCLDCGTNIPGTNCAYTLSRLEGWKNKPGCYSHCPCGYPVRTKELKEFVFKNFIDNDRDSGENAYIYCETSNGERHVYFGTFTNCVVGNGLPASGMSSCSLFERYASAE